MIKLTPTDHYMALPALQAANANTLFAESVAKNHLNGIIYVDQLAVPSVFYVCHPYQMSFLCGRSDNADFNQKLFRYLTNADGKRNSYEWLQTYPDTWTIQIETALGDKLIKQPTGQNYVPEIHETEAIKHQTLLFERINFTFDQQLYRQLRPRLWAGTGRIERTSRKMFQSLSGSVVPHRFWNDANHFDKNGVGFSLLENNELVSTAFASCMEDGFLEIGIETSPFHRGKGHAALACRVLLDYCLAHHLEPLWSCHGGNIGSIKLAEKLGFRQTNNTPYYRVGV